MYYILSYKDFNNYYNRIVIMLIVEQGLRYYINGN
jgi:hypothetical protein